MLTRLAGGRVIDPAHGIDGQVRDLYLRDGRIIDAPSDAGGAHSIDVSGRIVMAGAIDLHTHVGGAINARQTHLELADTPIVDKGCYAMLGNDDFFLRLLATGESQQRINDYVGWIMDCTHAIAIKVVNPGGISAFKFNQRKLDVDQAHPYYRVTPRRILQALARAVHDLGVPHGLHVHGCNLGVPGNVDTTLATIEAAEGLPIHLTHIQFHSYGSEGDRKFSSASGRIAEAINANPNVSADVGQIMFGQTVTASGDNMAQFRNADLGSPRKSGALYQLPAPDPAADRPCIPRPDAAEDPPGRARGLDPGQPDARVFAVRDRDHDARCSGAHAGAVGPRPPGRGGGGRHRGVPRPGRP